MADYEEKQDGRLDSGGDHEQEDTKGSELKDKDEEDDKDRKLRITIIRNGIPEEFEFDPSVKVRVVMIHALAPGEKDQVEQYQLVDRRLGEAALELEHSLKEAGVLTGDLLALTKRDGGGGCGHD